MISTSKLRGLSGIPNAYGGGGVFEFVNVVLDAISS